MQQGEPIVTRTGERTHRFVNLRHSRHARRHDDWAADGSDLPDQRQVS